MAGNSVNVVIQTKGAKEAASDIKSVGDSAQGAAPHIDKAGGSVTDLGNSAEKSRGLLGGLGGALGGMAKIAGGIIIAKAFEEGTSAIKGAFEASIEYQQLQAQTEAVLKSTGDASGMTGESIRKLAGSLSDMSGVQDETIQQSANMLLTFTNIGKTTFPTATAAVLDMNASFKAAGKDMNISDTAILVGKALNDPIKGISALHRVGVAFTDQQKLQVKAMMAVGDVAGAQGVILKELNTEFGGSAKAAGDTLGGQLNKLHNIWSDFIRDLAGKMLPTLVTVATFLVGGLTAALNAVGDAVGVLKRVAGDLGLGNLFRDIGAAIKLVFGDGPDSGGGMVLKFSDRVYAIVDVITTVRDIFKTIAGFAWDALKDGVGLLETLAGLAWDGLKDLGKLLEPIVGMAWDALKDGASALGNLAGMAWDGLKDGVGMLKDIGAISWDKVKDGAAALGDIAATKFDAVSGTLKDLGTNIKGIDLETFRSAWDKIKTALQPAYDILKPLVERVLLALKDQFQQVGAALVPLGEALKPLEPLLKPIAIILGVTIVLAIAALLLAFEGVIRLFTITLVAAIDTLTLAIKSITLAIDFVTAAVTVWPQDIGHAFLAVVNTVTANVGEIVDMVKSIPDKVGDMGSWLYDAGWDLVAGLFNGVTDKFTSAIGGIKSMIDPRNWDIPGLSPLPQAMLHAGQIAGDKFGTGLSGALGTGIGGAVAGAQTALSGLAANQSTLNGMGLGGSDIVKGVDSGFQITLPKAAAGTMQNFDVGAYSPVPLTAGQRSSLANQAAANNTAGNGVTATVPQPIIVHLVVDGQVLASVVNAANGRTM